MTSHAENADRKTEIEDLIREVRHLSWIVSEIEHEHIINWRQDTPEEGVATIEIRSEAAGTLSWAISELSERTKRLREMYRTA